MKKNRKLAIRSLLGSIIVLLLISQGSCASKQSAGNQSLATKQHLDASDNDSLMTLIPDYRGMVETNSVAAAWIEKGFSLKSCRNIRVLPVLNYSNSDLSKVQQTLQKDLENLFAPRVGGDRGMVSAQVLTAIIAARQKMDLLKRFSPNFDDIPSLTIEMIIVDGDTKKTLCKLCHSAKQEKFENAYSAVLNDLRRFVEHNL